MTNQETQDDSVIYQQRFYVDEQVGWTTWETIPENRVSEFEFYIENGRRYQMRQSVNVWKYSGYNPG